MKLRRPEPVIRVEVEPWIVIYTALLDGGKTVSWERSVNFEPSEGRDAAAGRLLAAGWVGEARYGVLLDGVFYPPHRIREITWKVA